VNAGITHGMSKTEFGSDKPVSREQMAVFFVRAMELEDGLNDLVLDIPFEDKDQIESWAKQHVAFSQAIGLIKGNGQSFMPKKHAERQAVARLIYEVTMDYEKYTPVIIKVIFEGSNWGEVLSVEILEDGSARIEFVNGDVVILTEDGELIFEVEYAEPENLPDYTVLDWHFLDDEKKNDFIVDSLDYLIAIESAHIVRELDINDIVREVDNLVFGDGGFNHGDSLIDAIILAAEYLGYVEIN
jgi:hypothetical protein